MFKHFRYDRTDCDTPKVIAGQGFAIAFLGLGMGTINDIGPSYTYYLLGCWRKRSLIEKVLLGERANRDDRTASVRPKCLQCQQLFPFSD